MHKKWDDGEGGFGPGLGTLKWILLSSVGFQNHKLRNNYILNSLTQRRALCRTFACQVAGMPWQVLSDPHESWDLLMYLSSQDNHSATADPGRLRFEKHDQDEVMYPKLSVIFRLC
jgi:hypothetical protein